MQLHKTEKARAELQPGKRSLNQRERTLLLLADGSKSMLDFSSLFNGSGSDIANALLKNGYLEIKSTAAPSAFGAVSSSEKSNSRPEPLHNLGFDSRPAPLTSDLSRKLPETALPLAKTIEAVDAAPAPAPGNAADNFDGKRSLATTRMFLFDICERLFARRNPQAADAFREALRSAKDRQTMLAVSREMIELIEGIAGHERADSISERIAMLLPSEQAA